MKGIEAFERTIRNYLEERAGKDPLLEATYRKPGQSIKGGITYILNTVRASGCNGYAEEGIFSMVVHYYSKYIVIQIRKFIIIEIQVINSFTC